MSPHKRAYRHQLSESPAIRKLEQHLFRTLCANCVPDSENTQIRRNGQSESRPISRPCPNSPMNTSLGSASCACGVPLLPERHRPLTLSGTLRRFALESHIANVGKLHMRAYLKSIASRLTRVTWKLAKRDTPKCSLHFEDFRKLIFDFPID